MNCVLLFDWYRNIKCYFSCMYVTEVKIALRKIGKIREIFMEVVVNQSFQTIRRQGKRFIISKVNAASRDEQTQQKKHPLLRYHPQLHINQERLACFGSSVTSVRDVRISTILPGTNCNISKNPFFKFSIPSEQSGILSSSDSLLTKSCRCFHTVPKGCLLNPIEVETFLDNNQIPYRKGYTGFLATCIDCDGNRLSEDKVRYNRSNLFIDSRTGNTLCKTCGAKGVWEKFKSQNRKKDEAVEKHISEPVQINFANEERLEESLQWLNSFRPIHDLSFNHPLLEGLCTETLQKFCVRITESGNVLFPCYDVTKETLVELRECYDNGKLMRVSRNKDLTSTSTIIFGWHLIKDSDKRVILTSSELDSIAVNQATGMPSLAVCNSNFTLDLFPLLEQFSEIYLWFNDEYREQENLQMFAKKLNLQRCFRIFSCETPISIFRKNSLKCLTKNESYKVFNSNKTNDNFRNINLDYDSEGHTNYTNGINKIHQTDSCSNNTSNYKNSETIICDCVHNAKPMSHTHIVTFKDLSNELYLNLIDAKKNAGTPFKRFPSLNEYLKGHRRGELTVFTGPTGSGKTTFLSELSLDLCMQGVRTLWGSFEIKNIRLMNTMMHQFTGFAIENHIDKYMEWSTKFEEIPLYFMNYYGAQNLSDVINTMEYAIYTYDIEHVVIDNLQFMISTSTSSSDDKFLVMEKAIAAFRKCASDHNVHITVVVHPRKEDDGGSLQTSSIYGSAKASQEADNVLILQTSEQLSMQVTKNRFCGSVGVLPLSFHPESLCLSGFHRNVETGEGILPKLYVQRPVQKVKVVSKNKKYYKS